MLQVVSPVAGHSLAVSDIPDPVFAKGLVGPGCAVMPRPGRQAAVAPVTGMLVKLHPHAYVVMSDSRAGVLVHLGIDTVHLRGEGFEPVREEHDHVEVGDEVVLWDPALVERAGRSPVCPVVVLDCDPARVLSKAVDVDVAQGDVLFEVDC